MRQLRFSKPEKEGNTNRSRLRRSANRGPREKTGFTRGDILPEIGWAADLHDFVNQPVPTNGEPVREIPSVRDPLAICPREAGDTHDDSAVGSTARIGQARIEQFGREVRDI
jgi:hypothetical protein